MEEDTLYLGDGVYAKNDGETITLTTNKTRRNDVIYLNPVVFLALMGYEKRMRECGGAVQQTVETPLIDAIVNSMCLNDDPVLSITERFEKVVDARISSIRSVLAQKGEEYASGTDPYHNFRVAGEMLGTTPETALKGYLVKHLVSVSDLIAFAGTDDEKITEHLIDEKIGDSINYLILLEGLLRERLEAR